MRVSPVLAFLVASSLYAAGGAAAQMQKKGAEPPKLPALSHQQARDKANENVVMILGGTLGAPYIQLAQDIALTLNDGDNLRVFPVASGGAVKNVSDVLLLRGVDLGITSVQVLNALKASGELGPNLDRRIAYIAPLSVDMFHVLARPEYTSVKQLSGKKVGVNLKGSGSHVFGTKILKAVGVEVEEVYVNPNEAVLLMRDGKLEANICLCPMPVPAYPSVSADTGFKFLEVPYIPALEESYLPASLPNETYPNLVAKDANVQTVATSTILITFNWAPGTERYRKIANFVNAFFSNFDKLRQPPRHPAWRSVNMAATVRGWQRFPAAQQWLDRAAAHVASKSAPGLDVTQAHPQAAKPAPDNAVEQERLFKEFMEWTRKRSKR